MELELRHLKVVSTIAEAGSVTKAAAELGVAQSALTAQLSRIERALGGAVFDRDHRGVRPTPLGELVIERARVLLPAMSGLMDDASRLSGTDPEGARTRRLSLGASTSAILAPLIQRLGGWRDDLRITTTASWSAEELMGQLAEGRLDVAVVGVCSGGPTPADPALTWRTFAVDPVFVMLPEGHALADRTEVRLSDLSGAEWAATPGDSCFQECFSAACAREGFTPRSLYVADAASCIDLVASGTAVALCQATRVLPGLRTVPLADAPLSWTHLVGWRTGDLDAELAAGIARTVVDAHRDLVDRSPVYTAWLTGRDGFGTRDGAGITPGV